MRLNSVVNVIENMFRSAARVGQPTEPLCGDHGPLLWAIIMLTARSNDLGACLDIEMQKKFGEGAGVIQGSKRRVPRRR